MVNKNTNEVKYNDIFLNIFFPSVVIKKSVLKITYGKESSYLKMHKIAYEWTFKRFISCRPD